jgi:hypothetical protein
MTHFLIEQRVFGGIPFASTPVTDIIEFRGLACVGGTMSQVIEQDVSWLREAPPASRTSEDWSAHLIVEPPEEDAYDKVEHHSRISFGWALAINAALWVAVAGAIFYFY